MGERLAFTFALTGRREWEHGTQGVALGWELAGLSARAGPQTGLFPHNLYLLNISILNILPCRGAFKPSSPLNPFLATDLPPFQGYIVSLQL